MRRQLAPATEGSPPLLVSSRHESGISLMDSVSAIHIRSMQNKNPSLLVFHGVGAEGRDTLAVQHIARLDLQLAAVPKIEDQSWRTAFVQPAG